jgi:hypothetical protein
MVMEPSGTSPDGLWVAKSSMDPVHPQDFVTGVEDDPSVYPTYPDVNQTVGETTLTANLRSGDVNIYITELSSAVANDPIGIVADDGTTFWTFIVSASNHSAILTDVNGEILYDVNGEILYGFEGTNYTVITTPLHADSSIGNVVYLPSLNEEEWQ